MVPVLDSGKTNGGEKVYAEAPGARHRTARALGRSVRQSAEQELQATEPTGKPAMRLLPQCAGHQGLTEPP